MKRLYMGLLVVGILAGSGQPAKAAPLFTFSALIDGVAHIAIPGSAAPATDHFDITSQSTTSGPFDAGGLGADIRITTATGVTMTSFQHTLNVIAMMPHTFTITINDLNNGLSGTFMVPFTLSAMYAEGMATSSVPTHSYVPMTFMIGNDTFTISDPASAFYTGPSAPPVTGGTSPISGAFLVHVNGVVGVPGGPIPEPGSLAVLGLCLVGLVGYRYRLGRRAVSVP